MGRRDRREEVFVVLVVRLGVLVVERDWVGDWVGDWVSDRVGDWVGGRGKGILGQSGAQFDALCVGAGQFPLG